MKLFKLIARLKNYFNRTVQYVVPLNSLLIILTYLEVSGYNVNPVYVMGFGVVFVLLVGYIDHKYILKHELEHVNQRNNMKQDLDLIKKKLEIYEVTK